MNSKEAEQILEDAEVVPVMTITLREGKELLESCLDADIPVVLGGGPGCSTGGCSPRVVLYAREEDLPQLRTLLEKRWRSAMEREGTWSPNENLQSSQETDGDPACPACGTKAPLVNGACSDCGLQLT